MGRIVCCGEGMIELRREGPAWQLGHGGDVLNTAIHLARLGKDAAPLTAVGGDQFSDGLVQTWAGEGLDCRLVLRHPTRSAGLYAISTDADGERSFTYWRDNSAARDMFALPEMSDLGPAIATAELFYFSLISLAILPREGRFALLGLAQDVRASGGRVAFDGNYRPRLWSCADEAREWRDAGAGQADIGLPTLEDERQLGIADANAVAAHWRAKGCAEVVVKIGVAGCLLPDGSINPPARRLAPVDTSGAGDAFNAGYLSARLDGVDSGAAAALGHEQAGWTIMRPGAIPARSS